VTPLPRDLLAGVHGGTEQGSRAYPGPGGGNHHLLLGPVCRLALRMTWRPADAEDATQEILIRVVTGLAS